MGSCWSSPSNEYISSGNARTSVSGNTGFSATSSSGGGIGKFSEAASASPDGADLNGEILETPNLKVFSFSDLKSATKNFKSDNLLGEGGFGKVYKGWVDEKTLAPTKMGSGMVVAIKKLNPESVQGFDQWQLESNSQPVIEPLNAGASAGAPLLTFSAYTISLFGRQWGFGYIKLHLAVSMSEVNFLGRLSHPNLVKLLGYCWEEKELLLVYEYIPKGSLENHLFRRNPAVEPLSWDSRLKIAIGAARGLSFLHSSEKKIIYRDFKASNILLDWHYNAKIADFGLAKLGPSSGESHVTTRIMGTYGYAAPEYIATGHLYVKSDVYGFGVVLLELLTGLRALDTKRPSGQQNLVDWTKPILSQRGKLKNIIDHRMEGQYSFKAVLQTAQLTLKCLAAEPRHRPCMAEVVETLERIESIKDKPKQPRTGSHSSANRL